MLNRNLAKSYSLQELPNPCVNRVWLAEAFDQLQATSFTDQGQHSPSELSTEVSGGE